MSNRTTNVPAPKLCECGCGQPAPIAQRTNTKFGHIKGKPVRFIQGHHNRKQKTRPLPERFWEKVQIVSADECWLWTAAVDTRGYGVIGRGGKIYRAHRIAWELTYGPISSEEFVLHHCDRPPCVNPAHLWLGDHADNMRDMSVKKRNTRGPGLRGDMHPQAKLTEQDVRQIRNLGKNQVPRAEIAVRFDVSVSTIYQILSRHLWDHVA